MTKVRIALLQYRNGYCADIEDSDECSLTVVSKPSSSARATCLAAASKLEELAKRFRVLAGRDDPARITTLDEVNRIPAARLS